MTKPRKCHEWNDRNHWWLFRFPDDHEEALRHPLPNGYCVTCGAKLNRDGTEEPRP